MTNDKALAGVKIVWIEDDKFLASMVGKRMTETGAELTQVVDGAKAFDVVKQSQPAIVVLDLLMPNVDGFEILRLMKSNSETKGIPVMILSNLGQKEEMEKAQKLGAAKFIIKATTGFDEIIPEILKVLKKK
jgi:two-component system phosphate regulon response regulator PhoB/two-component system alkaline phosphatase synthesis response regulator PhoP